MRAADLALYAAKTEGKGTYRFYDNAFDEIIRSRRALESELRQALTRGELEVFYQPLMNARSGRITGAEALVRWRHPVRGILAPEAFIALAEETGLIVSLGTFVLRRACEDAVKWPSSLSVAVNVSPAQFRDPALLASVREILVATSLVPSRLEIEITEGVLLSDERLTLATLEELRAIGVSLSMDDFGTGYSSLNYLRRF